MKMPVFVLLLMALLGGALAASLAFLAGYFIYAFWTGQLAHMPAEYIRTFVAIALETAITLTVLIAAPVFLGLHRLGWIRAWVSPVAGFVVGALPIGIRSWPWHPVAGHVTVSVMRGGKMVPILVNGVPTMAGWLDYAWTVLAYGALGAVGGLVFWLLWRKLQPMLERMPARR